jgi:hypothetical protein
LRSLSYQHGIFPEKDFYHIFATVPSAHFISKQGVNFQEVVWHALRKPAAMLPTVVLMLCIQRAVCGLLTPLQPTVLPCLRVSARRAGIRMSLPEGPVVVLGATGYIGRAVVKELVQRGRNTIAFVRPRGDAPMPPELNGATVLEGDPECDQDGKLRQALTGARGVISCISSRTGEPHEVLAIDYGASKLALDLLIEHGHPSGAYVLLSAICVKTPVLALHRAKLAFELDLANSGISHSIVRPTAYFKSISAQVANVVAGKSYVLFGDGTHTKCNAIGQG